MSAPPLPEIFGNYVLGDFVEVVPPDAISWLPQTVGWLWLGLALTIFSGHQLWKKLRHWYANRYRREAAIQIRLLADSSQGDTLLPELNRLLKRVALAAYPREQVAVLSGRPWADFLICQCPTPAFSDTQLELLSCGSYRGLTLDRDSGKSLLAAALLWTETHRGATDA